MKRRLVEQGGTTLMVSLPSKWAKKFNLKKGDEIEVSESGDVLCLSTDKETVSGKSTLDVTDVKNQEHVAHHFVPAYYRAGVDAVDLQISNSFDVGEFKKLLLKHGAVGFEIIHQGKSSLLIKGVTKSIDEEFEPILKRIFLLIKTLQTESLDLIKKKDLTGLKNLMHYNDTINRLTNICQRSLSKGLAGYSKKSFAHYIVCELERIVDEYHWLFDYFKDSKGVVLGDKFTGIYSRINDLFSSYFEIFYKEDISKMADLFDEVVVLIKEATDLMRKSESRHEAIGLHYLISVITGIYSILSPAVSLHAETTPSQQ